MLVTVKSREIQRGMQAEMRGDTANARRRFLAAAHLELVLAGDYAESDEPELAWRSRLSAASCFWRGGESELARKTFSDLQTEVPEQAEEVRQIISELRADALD